MLKVAAILQNGKTAVAVYDTIISTINDGGGGDHLTGLKEVIEREYPGCEHGILDKYEMTIAKRIRANLHKNSVR